MIEDACEKVRVFRVSMKSVRTVVTFIRSHRRVKAAYKRLAKAIDTPDTMPTLYTKTRLNDMDLTFKSY